MREHQLGIGLAVASTLGLSLATYYAFEVGSLYADRRPEYELETGSKHHIYLNEDIHALRARKSVDNFSLETNDMRSHIQVLHRELLGMDLLHR